MKYTIRLNDTYLADYDPNTGYQEFTQDGGYTFDRQEQALYALTDVVWGGDDESPQVVEVEVEK